MIRVIRHGSRHPARTVDTQAVVSTERLLGDLAERNG